MRIHSFKPITFDRQYCVCLWHGALRSLAVAMIAIYSVWQVYWLSRWEFPPALFLALTGLPAPTTGGIRSIVCLMHGDWIGSLHNNAMTIPMTVMAITCAFWATGQAYFGHQVRLPKGMGLAWAVVLTLAWSIKLIQVVTGS